MVRPKISSMPLSRTDPELEVHSVDDDKVKLGVAVQGKSIRLQSEVPRANKDINRTNSGDNGISVIEGNGKKNRCNDYGYDVTDSEDCGDSKIDLGYHFTWSDEDEPSFLDQKGFGLNVYESIRAISNEASKKIDAVLAVDLVDQLQEELRKLRSEVKRRKAEHADLKGIVQIKDHHIGTLELERDLYKADTTQLANDLETCLLKLRHVGGTSPSLSIGADVPVVATETNIGTKVAATDPGQDEKADNSTPSFDPSTPLAPLHISIKPKHSDTQERSVPNVPVFSSSAGTDTDSTTSNKSLSVTPLNTPPRLEPILPMRDKLRPEQFPSQGISTEVTSPKQRRKNVLLFALCLGNTNAKKKVHKVTQRISMEATDSGIHSQLIVKNEAVTKDDTHSELLYRPHGILRGQIQDMDQRLHLSIKTSEDLRRRLAMVHLYYENHVNYLDRRPIVDKNTMKCGITDQQPGIERQRESAVTDLESQYHNPEIQSLRKHRVVTFNV